MKEPIRFSGAPWYDYMKSLTCTIVGVGATGSYAAFFLGRLGIPNFNLIDPDIVEEHNLGSQMFSKEHFSDYKCNAVEDILQSTCNPKSILTEVRRIEDLSEYLPLNVSNIVLSTLDSMSGRKFLFEKFIQENCEKNSIFFDSRIGAELWEVYVVPKNNQEAIERYKETLFSDEEGNTGACNFQQSSHSAAGAAIQIAETITQWVVNILTDETDLPFKITKNLRTSKYGVIY